MFKNLTKPYIIAELSGNHNGSLDRAKDIILSAKNNGAVCVKLQTYTPDTMTIKSNKKDFLISDGLWNGYNLWDLYNEAHTPYEWQEKLFNYAKSIDIPIISTPFDETAVDLLERIKCPFYKIASFELTDLPLIEYIAKTNKPIIASTGMANEEEIGEAVDVIKQYGCGELVLLHCVSGYPTPAEQINLETISLLKNKFKTEVGLSDHTIGNTSAILSVAYGVKVIEKHYTLKRSDGGPDAEFSMEPSELKDLVKNVEIASKSMGRASFERKKAEESNIKFRRSIYIVKDMKKGEQLKEDSIRRIRPGFGLPPKYYNQVLGKTLNIDVEKGTALDWSIID
jgi:N-acetylneuraminate synthase